MSSCPLTSLYRRYWNLKARSVFDPSRMVLAEHIEMSRLKRELEDIYGRKYVGVS